jgi:NADH:ubiquinone oxidoreductase subunit F (NADH-binding)
VQIVQKLKKANLTGRGGPCFPTGQKWEMVKKAKGEHKYVVCNASEGEPGICKDYYIFEHYTERLIDGMEIAMEYLDAHKGYIYLNPDYYKKFARKLTDFTDGKPIEIVRKPDTAGYIGGEETSMLNALEGGKIEPRLKPPFPPQEGLWHQPTLVNNVETFYDVSLVAHNEYEAKRFFTINGDCLWTGVYHLPENMTIEKVLKETDNYPDFDFFAQVGGDASGEVLNSLQLKRPAGGGASITVYSSLKHHPLELIRKWVDFFASQSCGQCTPCREGMFRLKQLVAEDDPDWRTVADIFEVLSDTSFCGLGCAAPVAVTSYVKNVLEKSGSRYIDLPDTKRKAICDCFN